MIVELVTSYGTMFVPDNDQGQYWWLKHTGASPEDYFIEEVCALLDERPKGCAVDVGANFGCWTLALAKHAHTVVAIEPQRCIHELLAKSIAATGARNVELLHCAAGGETYQSEIASLRVDLDTNFGGIGLSEAAIEQPEAAMEPVTVRPLDVLLAGYMVSFIKIDTEGYEQNVLYGARHTIERCKPILFVEMDHPKTNAAALAKQIEAHGYILDKLGGNYLGLPV